MNYKYQKSLQNTFVTYFGYRKAEQGKSTQTIEFQIQKLKNSLNVEPI